MGSWTINPPEILQGHMDRMVAMALEGDPDAEDLNPIINEYVAEALDLWLEEAVGYKNADHGVGLKIGLHPERRRAEFESREPLFGDKGRRKQQLELIHSLDKGKPTDAR